MTNSIHWGPDNNHRLIWSQGQGGKIEQLRLGGRDWLWTSDVLRPRPYQQGDTYIETADTGGWDECFPTVAPCKIPSEPVWGTLSGQSLQDHGLLWSETPESTVNAQRIWSRWSLPQIGCSFERTLSWEGRVLRIGYRLENQLSTPLPFIWSSHPLFPLSETTRIELPDHFQTQLDASHHLTVQEAPALHRWPRLQSADEFVDLSRPAELKARLGHGYACKVFVRWEGRVTLVEGRYRLTLEADPKLVPDLGVWINAGGWTPFPTKKPYWNLALEPCLGAPDSLVTALTCWDRVQRLPETSIREWNLNVTAVELMPASL